MALLMSFDAVAGAVERGASSLALTHRRFVTIAAASLALGGHAWQCHAAAFVAGRTGPWGNRRGF